MIQKRLLKTLYQLTAFYLCKNSDSDTPKQTLHITKKQQSQKCHQEPIFQYIGHVCRHPNTMLTKEMLFAKSRRPYKRDPSRSHSTGENTAHRSPWINIAKLLNVSMEQAKRSTQEVLLHWSTV